MLTLHAYILRELLKAFGLAVLALTALFTMGGGLYNVLKFEGLSAGDLFSVLPLMIPVAITITMPVAAIFAATITYGRLAADNELVACRAAGINVHTTFLAAILLSVFVALCTTLSVNVLIPRFVDHMVGFAKGNVRQFAYNKLLQHGYVSRQQPGEDGYTLTAQTVKPVDAQELINKGFDPPGDGVSYMWVERPTLLHSDKNGELKRFSVAEGGLCQFDTRGDTVNFTLYVKNARDYEVGKRVVQIDQQKVGPYEQKIPFTPKPSMVSLAKLRQWRQSPWLNGRVAMKAADYLSKLRCSVFLHESGRVLENSQTLTLYDDAGDRYEMTAGACEAGARELVLADVVVIRSPAQRAESAGSESPVRYEAPRGRLRAAPLDDSTIVELQLDEAEGRPILEIRQVAGRSRKPRDVKPFGMTDLQIPAAIREQMDAYSPERVLDPTVEIPSEDELQKQRERLQEFSSKQQRKIVGVIHFRMSFAASALVTILMGAALGVMFRGARALAAFGLACIPFLAAALLIMMGKQLTESESTHLVGPYVIWGGLVLVAITDALILRVGVRR